MTPDRHARTIHLIALALGLTLGFTAGLIYFSRILNP